ncbi:insulinase family protein [Desulfobulbus alkaliphilus]|uniref:insulinase family protein n=1 Tax=Desulfobulbus alkaliphilus TaxID=869814 RepID=UPI00196498EF|nr:insulinase family protein [Desulfobulbus alkaliphilus]MBM9536691.1 insulinase family protein [Desulfobulbus alkaliphilus]
MTSFAQGSIYHGFLLEQKAYIDEIHSTVFLFTHTVLGCQAVAIKNQDANKTFCVSFLTVPEDSTGVAHILEHSVLMGSKKYPIRDVFGEINKGGLMTFLNAMTGSDTTWYPFATRNLKEYFNIMDVYCDVTFHPLLLQSTFEQEGWHYHLENIDDPVQYTGVVFNEMKGAYSDPIRALFHHTFRGLMPNSTYAHESGGSPRHIPDLSYEQFLAFHRSHYHPANSTFFFYGDAPLDQELAYIQEHILRHYPTPVPRAIIREGDNLEEPLFIEESYPVQPGSSTKQKTFVAISSAVGTVHDRKLSASFQIIANILYNSDGSPLKKAIINAALCKDFGGLFLSNSSLKTLIITYLVGTDPDKRDHFLALYKATLTRMVEAGLDKDLVLSELNKYEFTVREEMNKAQRGLDLIGKALPAMKHGMDPFQALQMDALLAEIRREATENGYFEQLIRTHVLNNPATVTVALVPDPKKMVIQQQEEQNKLETFAQTLDAVGRQRLVEHTRELMALQTIKNTSTDLHCLPRLSLEDLDPQPPFHAVQPSHLAGVELLINDLETNGICYLDFGLDCSMLPAGLLPYLDLFATILTEIGTQEKDYMQFAKAINRCTGDFSHSFQVYLRADDRNKVRPILWLHMKALSSHLDEALALLTEVLASVSFSDREHIEEIVQREFAWAEHAAQSEGYTLASTRAFSHLSRAGAYNEYVHGIHAYQHLKDLAGTYQQREETFLAALEHIRNLLFRQAGVIVAITGEDGDIRRFQNLGASVIKTLPAPPLEHVQPQFTVAPARQAFTTSADVVYNVQSCPLFADPAGYNGSFEVLRTWLSRDYLWNTVRQMGGAYGCFVQFNHLSGNFGMVSYRDPQVRKTYEAYAALPNLVKTLDLSTEVLHQLLIGAYSSCTPHQGPASRGAAARNDYLSGITTTFKQKRIEEILTTSIHDLRRFAPLLEQLQTDPVRTTIGSRGKIEQDDHLFDDIIEL